jgi:hypothetical protein
MSQTLELLGFWHLMSPRQRDRYRAFGVVPKGASKELEERRWPVVATNECCSCHLDPPCYHCRIHGIRCAACNALYHPREHDFIKRCPECGAGGDSDG